MAATEVWKGLLKQHDKLKKQATASVYDRVTLLAKVWEDPNYLDHCRKQAKSPGEDMNERVNDTCANWTELYQMLKMFPKRSDWLKGDLSKMRMDMLNKLREQQNGRKEKKPRKKVETRKTATLTEVRDLTTEKDRLKEQLASANKYIQNLEAQLEDLREQLKVSRETIGSLNEIIALSKVKRTSRATKAVKA